MRFPDQRSSSLTQTGATSGTSNGSKSAGDGVEVQARVTWTWEIRDGAVERLCMYQERAKTLEAAGLQE